MATTEQQGLNGSKRQAGYFCHLSVDDKHAGAIMVTNQIGVPLEFKYTEPIVVTKMHKLLYGSSLDRYLHETVIRERLARELQNIPEFFLAPYDEKEFIGPIAEKEMIAIQRIKAGQMDLTGPLTRLRDREVIIELEDGVLLRLAFSTLDDAVQRYAVTWLQELGRTMDVLEPLDRIAHALRNVCFDQKKA
jgi:hypothetical protein